MDKSKSEDNLLKIVIMGGGGVGKSALTVKYTQGYFVDKYDPTIEDSYRKHVTYNQKIYTVEILDTAGADQFSAMRDLYIQNADCVIMVFSLTSKSSLKDLEDIYEQIKKRNEEREYNIPIIICANKYDLVDSRVIERAMYTDISNKYNAKLFETSPKMDDNLNTVFEHAIKMILKHNNPKIMKRDRKKINKCVLI